MPCSPRCCWPLLCPLSVPLHLISHMLGAALLIQWAATIQHHCWHPCRAEKQLLVKLKPSRRNNSLK